jgi:DNA-binding phage protein
MRHFKKTIYNRARRDAAFRKTMLADALNAFLDGDHAAGKMLLRDLIGATGGFEQLAVRLRKSSKSLHRMLGPRGNPTTSNFFTILKALQKTLRIRLTVQAD